MLLLHHLRMLPMRWLMGVAQNFWQAVQTTFFDLLLFASCMHRQGQEQPRTAAEAEPGTAASGRQGW